MVKRADIISNKVSKSDNVSNAKVLFSLQFMRVVVVFPLAHPGPPTPLLHADTARHAACIVKYSTPSGPKSIADISISHAQQQVRSPLLALNCLSHIRPPSMLLHVMWQDGFESDMAYGVKWMRWKVPICISYNGLFLHEEIETSA